jgi:hypothetical protein
MKSFILVALLSASALAAKADIIVVPSPQGCAQAKINGDKVVIAACAKMAKGEPVNLACPITGGCQTTTK